MYFVEKLEDLIPIDDLKNLRLFLKNSTWNYKIPGGFLTNYPQRKENTKK